MLIFCIHVSFLFVPRHRKHVFGHMRTAKAQITLRVRAVWSRLPLSANRLIGYYRKVQTQVVPMRRMTWICAFCACSKACFSPDAAHLRELDAFCYFFCICFKWRHLLCPHVLKKGLHLKEHILSFQGRLFVRREVNNAESCLSWMCINYQFPSDNWGCVKWKCVFSLHRMRRDRSVCAPAESHPGNCSLLVHH